jgi:N-acetylneuraminic acid mutarotase
MECQMMQMKRFVRALLLSGVVLAGASLGLADGAAKGAAKNLPAAYASMPQGVSSFGAVSSDGWLYVYGGHLDKTHTYSASGVSDKFHRLNLKDGKTWEELPSGPVLQGMNLAAYKGKIYRAGGMQPQNKPGEKSDNKSQADVSVYDPATRTWEALPPLPVPRSSHDVAIIGSKLYVIGGWTQLGGEAKPTWPTDMVVLDLEKPTEGWKSVKQPFIRRAFIAAVLDGKLYVMGGLDQEVKRLQLTEIYDPATDSWSKGPSFPGGDRNGFAPSAAVMNGSLYMNMADGSMQRLSDKGDAWVQAGKSEPRIVGRMVSNGDQLLVIGGSSKVGAGRMMNEIEVVKVE